MSKICPVEHIKAQPHHLQVGVAAVRSNAKHSKAKHLLLLVFRCFCVFRTCLFPL